MPLFLDYRARLSFLLWGGKSPGAEEAKIEGFSRKKGQVL
jgi:hypothetical protein